MVTAEVIDIKEVDVKKIERIATLLKTIAHPLRLGVVHLLEKNARLSVTEICELLDSEQSLTSHHLQVMRVNGILQVEREGRSMYYSLKNINVTRLMECVEHCPG
jgi:DNA-binding transcriptional ArsR family regulator